MVQLHVEQYKVLKLLQVKRGAHHHLPITPTTLTSKQYTRTLPININVAKMKTSQLLAAGALLAGYAQACTRVRVDMVSKELFAGSDSLSSGYLYLQNLVGRPVQPQWEVHHHHSLGQRCGTDRSR